MKRAIVILNFLAIVIFISILLVRINTLDKRATCLEIRVANQEAYTEYLESELHRRFSSMEFFDCTFSEQPKLARQLYHESMKRELERISEGQYEESHQQ